MTEKASVPGVRGDLAMPDDRFAPGGDHALPRQGFPPTMPIGTANGEHRMRLHLAEDGA